MCKSGPREYYFNFVLPQETFSFQMKIVKRKNAVLSTTAIFGAVLLTGYLGGAIASHVRVSNPLFSHSIGLHSMT